MTDSTQWSTIAPYVGAFPAWAGAENQMRIASYALYEDMYWNVPETYKLAQRGADSKPIYIPAARQIVETMHRYLAPGLSIIADPALGTDSERAKAMELLTPFLRREAFLSKFTANKRFGLIRGDSLWHIFADAELPEGSRISIEAVDPASYFPIYADDEVTIIGCHLVDFVLNDKGETLIYRQTYRKVTGMAGPSPITRSSAIFEVDAWGGPGQEKEEMVSMVDAEEQLPPDITAVPVYHIPNAAEPGTPWGSSELRGLERILAAINQSISDEEIELVLNGLGVYVTDSGSPINENTGEPEPWNLGPAKVIELPDGKTFQRVTGTSSVQPHQDHLKYLHDQLDLTTGSSAAAKGSIDVTTEVSGISLLIQLAPIFARAEEKELIITDILTQMFFDLKAWFSAYEGVSVGAAVWVPIYGNRVPINPKERFEQVMAMVAAKVVSAAWARKELTKIGYDFGDDTEMIDQIATEMTLMAQIETDVTGSRMDSEIDA